MFACWFLTFNAKTNLLLLCGKVREKPGPKPRERAGDCFACLGEHVAHTCGTRGKPEVRVSQLP